LKENVILGRLIPAGTGFEGSKKRMAIEQLQSVRRTKIAAETEAAELEAEKAFAEANNA
jgi:hypothetical protein